MRSEKPTSRAFDASASSIVRSQGSPHPPMPTKDSIKPVSIEQFDGDVSPIPSQRQAKNSNSLSSTKMGGTLQVQSAGLQPDNVGTGGDRGEQKQETRTVVLRSNIQKHKQLLKLMNRSVNECKYCQKPQKDLRKVIHDNVYQKYESSTQKTYNTNIVNDIIFNSNTHIVSVFKDYLIQDDITEFMKRYYAEHESHERLHKLCVFYDKYSKVFANYVALEEKKYMFKNIERKQKMIDEKHDALQKAKESGDDLNDRIFTQKFVDQLSASRSRLQISAAKKLDLADLVDKFIDCDSQSMINATNCEGIEASFTGPPPAKREVTKKPAAAINGLLAKAENAKRKSLWAQAAVASTKAKKFVATNIPAVQPATTRYLTTGGPAPVRHVPSTSIFPMQMAAPVQASALMMLKIQKPPSELGSKGRLSAGGHRPTVCSPKSVRGTGISDPLNININLNVILNKDKSAAPQSCTAAGMYRYKSLERARSPTELPPRSKPHPHQQQQPQPLPFKLASRAAVHHGSTLRSRQDTVRSQGTQNTAPRLERVYSNPSVCGRSKDGSRRNVRRRAAESVGAYRRIGEILSPTNVEPNVRVAYHHTKTRSAVPGAAYLPAGKKLVFKPQIQQKNVRKARNEFVVTPGGSSYGRSIVGQRQCQYMVV